LGVVKDLSVFSDVSLAWQIRVRKPMKAGGDSLTKKLLWGDVFKSNL